MSSDRNQLPPPRSTALARSVPGGLSEPKYSFADQNEFHATVLRTTLGASAGALAAYFLSHLGSSSDPGLTFTATTVAAGALMAVAGKSKNFLRALAAGALGILGGVLNAASVNNGYPWLGALLIGLTAAPVLAKGETPAKMAITGVATGMLTFLGLYVTGVLQSRGILVGILPPPLATAVAGSAAGLFIGLGSAPRHIVPAQDPVEAAYRAALGIHDGEIHEILNRAFTIHGAVRNDLVARKIGPTEVELGRRVSDLSLRILQIAEQCRSIERDLGATPATDLEARIQTLTRKAEAATDESARVTFHGAIKSLDGQRRAVEAIGRGLERVVARLHANVALLEKVRFSLVHARSADAERIGGEASPLTEAIEELSRELDATSLAVGEVFSESGSMPVLAAESPSGITSAAALLPPKNQP